tara:strand:+ start:653 stop:907 length:255 start_codon:yes stop_codon:yes gene_type:complete
VGSNLRDFLFASHVLDQSGRLVFLGLAFALLVALCRDGQQQVDLCDLVTLVGEGGEDNESLLLPLYLDEQASIHQGDALVFHPE